MWVLKGFSVVFDASNLSCHYSELLFLSLRVDYLEQGWGGEHLLDLSGCCQSLKVEVTEEIKEQQTVKWWCLEEAGHEDCHAEAAKYTCPCDVQGRH